MSHRLLYVGANVHLDPLEQFQETKDFVFIDTLPRSEFDREGIFNPSLYSETFVYRLNRKASRLGFQLIYTKCIDPTYHKSILALKQRWSVWLCSQSSVPPFEYLNPTLLHFYNATTDQNLYYYISTNIINDLNMTPCLRAAIASCTGLIISGYHPRTHLLELIRNRPIALFCYSHTCYEFLAEEEDDDDDNIVFWMHANKSALQKNFFPIYACNLDTGNSVLCENFQEMVTITTFMFKKSAFNSGC